MDLPEDPGEAARVAERELSLKAEEYIEAYRAAKAQGRKDGEPCRKAGGAGRGPDAIPPGGGPPPGASPTYRLVLLPLDEPEVAAQALAWAMEAPNPEGWPSVYALFLQGRPIRLLLLGKEVEVAPRAA